jgi:small subunit ribosomal protein S6
MKTVAYEALLLLDAGQPDDQIRATIDKYTGIITAQGGTVDDVDRWDPRRLAYEVKRKREGIYVVVNFVSTAAARDEMHRVLGISDDTLRATIYKQSPKADRFPSRIRAAEQERREREQAARAATITPAPAAPVVAEPITDLSASATANVVSEEDKAAADATDAEGSVAAEDAAPTEETSGEA